MEFSSHDNSQKNQKGNFIIIHESAKKVQLKLAELFDPWQESYNFQCLMILNYDLNLSLLRMLERKCQHIILVDGGANHLYKSELKDSKKVKCIIGDFDEVQENVVNYYQQKGVKIEKDTDQDTTDYQKSIRYAQKLGTKTIVVLGVLGGRLDHTLNSMHITEKVLRQKQANHVILIGMNSIMLYLHKNIQYTLNMDSLHLDKKGCGLITFNRVNKIETEGFKWNMGEKHHFESLEWGQFLSTSNQIQDSQIKVLSSEPVYYIGQIKTIKQ